MSDISLFTNPETGLTDISLIKEGKVIKSIRLTSEETSQLRKELDVSYQRTLKTFHIEGHYHYTVQAEDEDAAINVEVPINNPDLFLEPSEVWEEKEGGK